MVPHESLLEVLRVNPDSQLFQDLPVLVLRQNHAVVHAQAKVPSRGLRGLLWTLPFRFCVD